MLVHVNVTNIALIHKTSLDLHENLNILTGETGAGKSMLIDSINFALGQRAPRTIIRRGEKYAKVELLFESKNPEIKDKLNEIGIEQEDDNILMSRKLQSNGRSVYKMNGQTANRKMIRKISSVLLDVHGQHEHQSLLNSSKHIKMLDKLGNEKLYGNLDDLGVLYKEYKVLQKKLDSLPGDDKSRAQMIDILKFQIQEIKDAGLCIDEQEGLEEDMKVLSNSEEIKENLHEAYECLTPEDTSNAGAMDMFGKAIRNIMEISDNSKDIKDILGELQSVESIMIDVISTIRDLYENTEYSPELLFETEQRLDLIYNLERKYGDSIEEVLDHYDGLCEKLDTLENSDEKRIKINKKILALENKMVVISKKITKIRNKVATKVSKQVEKELHELQIENAKFKIEVTPSKKIKANGMDDVEFMISTNKGEPIQPLKKVASGGEMSRVMLALKTVLADKDEISTLIFDEIDTGISGRTAQKVAEKLAFIAKEHQVICITHLPQIAAMSDYHYLITKDDEDNRTNTSVELLNSKNVTLEIGRLMAGAKITDTTLKSAREIKRMANEFKLKE